MGIIGLGVIIAYEYIFSKPIKKEVKNISCRKILGGVLIMGENILTSNLTDKEKLIMDGIDEKKVTIKNIAERIYEFNEIGWEEFKSSKLLMDQFEEDGFIVERGLIGKHPKYGNDIDMPTAFKAVYEGEKGGPTIGVMLEYDALPNGHSCGHNLIASSGYTAAIGLKKLFERIPGKVMAFGTPAEELDGAKPNILAAGYMDEVDLMLVTHPRWGEKWNSEINVKAIVWPTHDNWLTFHGQASHASAAPEKGRSALDAAMLCGMGLEFMREHMVETNRIHYIFSESGTNSNSVPEFTRVKLELRANQSAELNALIKRVDDVIQGAALMTGTTAKYRWDAPWYTQTPLPNLYKLAAEISPALGIDKSKFTFNTPAGGSSDVGSVAYKIPTLQIGFPTRKEGEAELIPHSVEVAEMSGNDYPIEQSILAGKLLALVAYRIGTNPEELKKVKDEFEKNYKE